MNEKHMLPIVYEGAYAFLQSNYFSDAGFMPYPISHGEYDAAIDNLWDSADWRKSVFGVKKVTRYNINSFFFQLLATGILRFEWTNATMGIVLVVVKDTAGKFKYHTLSYWYGFKFRSKTWGGNPVAFSSLK